MRRFTTFFALAVCCLSAAAVADPVPATGKFLVAADDLHGDYFGKTVVLLLQYDATGAMGLVINRPTDVTPDELLDDPDAFPAYSGTLYWGGPVQMTSLRALVRSDAPPTGARAVVDDVYLLPIDDALALRAVDTASLRLFIGYSGWAPGQLERELAGRSWHVVSATAELVFAEDPSVIWQRLVPPTQLRASLDH
jgi:putative transcriptional regulator